MEGDLVREDGLPGAWDSPKHVDAMTQEAAVEHLVEARHPGRESAVPSAVLALTHGGDLTRERSRCLARSWPVCPVRRSEHGVVRDGSPGGEKCGASVKALSVSPLGNLGAGAA